MNRRELEQAIRDEVAEWPGAEVQFVDGGKHPKAKLQFGGLMMSVPYPGTPGDSRRGLHITLSQVRRTLRKLDAERPAPEPSEEETERRYVKPNDGAARRPDPVAADPATPRPDAADQLLEAGVVTEAMVAAARATAHRAAVAVAEQDVLAVDDTEEEQAARIAALQAQIEAIEDGVYFGLPAEVYHAVPRLSSSGLQKLCVDPSKFWAGSWLDPNRPELDDDETKAQQLGKAYHVARLEPERFHATYVRELSKADFPARGFLSSDDKVKAELKARDLQQTVKGETMGQRAQRLLDDGFEGTCLTLEKERWEAGVAGRIPLAARHFDQIIVDMERIRGNGEVADLLTGGEAEVSVFWTDEHGLRMKARLDYLTRAWWADLKTIEVRDKELEQAIADAFRFNRYHVQAATYRDAVEALRRGGLQVRGDASDAQRALVASIQIRPEELACWYVFTGKSGVPCIVAYEFEFLGVDVRTHHEAEVFADNPDETRALLARATDLFRRARMDAERAKRAFVLYSQSYNAGTPWYPLNVVRSTQDLFFNQKWLEGAL